MRKTKAKLADREHKSQKLREAMLKGVKVFTIHQNERSYSPEYAMHRWSIYDDKLQSAVGAANLFAAPTVSNQGVDKWGLCVGGFTGKNVDLNCQKQLEIVLILQCLGNLLVKLIYGVTQMTDNKAKSDSLTHTVLKSCEYNHFDVHVLILINEIKKRPLF